MTLEDRPSVRLPVLPRIPEAASVDGPRPAAWRWMAIALTGMFAGCLGVITDPENAGGVADPGGDLAANEANAPAIRPVALPIVTGREFVCDADARPAPPVIRRLTRAEYLGSIEGLTGVAIEPSAFPQDDFSPQGFSNQGNALTVQYDQARAFAAIATRVVQSLSDVDGWIASFAGCRESSADCRRGYIDRLTRAAFGAPPSNAERDTLLSLFEAANARGQGFREGALDILEVVLQAPRFVYRLESEFGAGERRPLDPHELARRLALLVTGRAPDAALLDVAESGGLATVQGITGEVDRLLAVQTARDGAHAFASDWLNLDSVGALQRDRMRFPTWSDGLAAEMRQETIDVFDTVAFSEAPIAQIFAADFTIVGPALASHYGFESSGRVSLADASERGGLLTHAGLLAASGGARASPVDRGFFMSALITCGAEIQQPPANADLSPPGAKPGASVRTFSEVRVNDPSCGGCHAAIEPPVWGLVRYDGVGAYSETDELGNPLATDGYIEFVTGGQARYESARELGSALAGSDRVQECLLLKMSTYALGRELEPADTCDMAAVRERFFASNGTYRDLLLAVAQSPLFQSNPTTDPL